MRRAALGALVVGLLALPGCTGGTPIPDPAPSPAASCRATVPGDVNGDGYADVAVGAPGADQGAGAVHLFYGDSGRLATIPAGTTLNDVEIIQDSPDVPDAAEPGDAFGSSVQLGDVNGDLCADLVVGSRGEDGVGSITVLYGAPTGLTTTGSQQFTMESLFPEVSTAADASFGDELAVADLDGDGIGDVVSGGGSIGSLAAVYGSRSGLDRGRQAARWDPDDLGAINGFTTGDFNGDSRIELAVAADGGVSTFRFDQGQLTRTRTVTFSTPYLRLERARESLRSADVTGDGRDDVVLAGPGRLALLPGSAHGLSAATQNWSADSPGLDARAGFGTTLAVGSLDGDRYADVAVSDTGALDVPAGASGVVTVLRGSASGLSTAGYAGTSYRESTPGIVGTDESGDGFGAALTISRLAGRGPGTLVVGTPGEDTGTIVDAGAITQFGASASGPEPRESLTLTLDSPGVTGSSVAAARFGASLA